MSEDICLMMSSDRVWGLCLRTSWDIGFVNTEMLPLPWDGDLHLCGVQWLLLDSFHLSSTWEVWNNVSMRISKFPSKYNNPSSLPCGLTPVTGCCGYVWCEFFIRSMTTKKELQKRRPITLSCGMLEVLWAVPPVWKAHEQCSIICWMVSLLGVNMILILFL